MDTIYRAVMESRHFTFEAYAATEDAARLALLDGLQRHTAEYRLAPDWYTADDVSVTEHRLGAAYRDGWEIPRCTSDDPTNHQGNTCPIHEMDGPR